MVRAALLRRSSHALYHGRASCDRAVALRSAAHPRTPSNPRSVKTHQEVEKMSVKISTPLFAAERWKKGVFH